MRLYLAGPLFTAAERRFNEDLAAWFRIEGYDVFNPQEYEPRDFSSPVALTNEIFKVDKEGIDWADVVVANMDGPDPDSGTAWECGYAYGIGKPVVTYRTDFRGSGEAFGIPFNIMMLGSSELAYATSTPVDRIAVIAGAIVKVLKTYEDPDLSSDEKGLSR